MTRETGFESQYRAFCQSLLKHGKNAEEGYDYYIFISRKCYYYTKAIAEKYGLALPVQLLRDRDVLKELDLSVFTGKRVLLVDDTFHRGVTLKGIIEHFGGNDEKGPFIDIAIFYLTPEGMKNLMRNQGMGCREKMFYQLCPEHVMSQFVLSELKLIHRQRYPYVIDLPVFDEINMEYAVFRSLIRETNFGWVFHEYKVRVQNETYGNGFFIYENSFLGDKFGGDLLRLVIKCRYEVEETEGGTRVLCRFTPFAMLRSVPYDRMRQYFSCLFEGTSYLKRLEEQKGEAKDDFIAVYRAVVYAMSYLIGRLFGNYMENIFDISGNLKDNLSEWEPNRSFRGSILKMFSDFEASKFYRRLENMQNGAPFALVKNVQWDTDAAVDIEYTEKWLMGRLAKCKRAGNGELQDQLVTQEQLEGMLLEKFQFRNEKQFQTALICMLLKLLDTGFISNTLTEKDGMIYRSYRLGESSSLLTGYDFKYFYAAVYAYYNLNEMSAEKYRSGYSIFLHMLNSFFRREDYYDHGYITPEDFRFFSDYFYMDGAVLKREMENKRYVLLNNLNEEEKPVKDIFDFVFGLRNRL